jgi:hypothetical protein
MQAVVAHRPAIARPIRWRQLYDQLELSLQLLRQEDWPDLEFDQSDQLPPKLSASVHGVSEILEPGASLSPSTSQVKISRNDPGQRDVAPAGLSRQRPKVRGEG